TISTLPARPLTVMAPFTCGSERRKYTYPAATTAIARSTRATVAFASTRSMGESYSLPRSASSAAALKPVLDRLYLAFNHEESASDPIHIVRRFTTPEDREVVAFCASALAFGRVGSVLQSIERVVSIIGGRPADYVRHFDPRRDGRAFDSFVHRWTRGV